MAHLPRLLVVPVCITCEQALELMSSAAQPVFAEVEYLENPDQIPGLISERRKDGKPFDKILFVADDLEYWEELATIAMNLDDDPDCAGTPTDFCFGQQPTEDAVIDLPDSEGTLEEKLQTYFASGNWLKRQN